MLLRSMDITLHNYVLCPSFSWLTRTPETKQNKVSSIPASNRSKSRSIRATRQCETHVLVNGMQRAAGWCSDNSISLICGRSGVAEKKTLTPQEPSCPLLSSSSTDQTLYPRILSTTFRKESDQYDTTVTGSVLIYFFSDLSQKNRPKKN
jgi:hypothetical protein